MIDTSRTDIYDYIYGLLYNVVSKNVYRMFEPQELTDSDTKDGFIVISVGEVNDASEFYCEAFGWVRVYVEAYVPTMSRGRLDKTKYKAFEEGITEAINAEMATCTNEHYSIIPESVLSYDGAHDTNANNFYHMYIKSFIVTID